MYLPELHKYPHRVILYADHNKRVSILYNTYYITRSSGPYGPFLLAPAAHGKKSENSFGIRTGTFWGGGFQRKGKK